MQKALLADAPSGQEKRCRPQQNPNNSNNSNNSHNSNKSKMVVTYTPPVLRVALTIKSSRVLSFRSSWWLPLPLVMISTPLRLCLMCGLAGVKSSSQVSTPSEVSRNSRYLKHPKKNQNNNTTGQQ